MGRGGDPLVRRVRPKARMAVSQTSLILAQPQNLLSAAMTVLTRSAHTHRRQERRETHLRHMSPVSVMLGCQILVRHFTLGGCNTERRKEITGSPDHACCHRPHRALTPPLTRPTRVQVRTRAHVTRVGVCLHAASPQQGLPAPLTQRFYKSRGPRLRSAGGWAPALLARPAGPWRSPRGAPRPEQAGGLQPPVR